MGYEGRQDDIVVVLHSLWPIFWFVQCYIMQPYTLMVQTVEDEPLLL